MKLIRSYSLTGEGEAQPKVARVHDLGVTSTIFDLKNVVFSGTSVVSGTGLVVAFSTGKGKPAQLIQKLKETNQGSRHIYIDCYENVEQPAPP